MDAFEVFQRSLVASLRINVMVRRDLQPITMFDLVVVERGGGIDISGIALLRILMNASPNSRHLHQLAQCLGPELR